MITRRVLLLSFAVTLSWEARGHAQPTDPPAATYTLADALKVMRAEHPLLRGAEAGVRAARADETFARLWTNPVLGGTYTKGIRRSSYDDAGYVSYGLTQFVELSNTPGARGQAARLLVGAARADLTAVDFSLGLDVEDALIDVRAIGQKVTLVEAAVGLIDRAAVVVGQRVSAGAAPRYDANRIAVTAANAHADLASLRADLVHATATLRGAVGPGFARLQGEPSYALDDAPPLPAAAELRAALEQRRPDVEAARQRAASASAQVSVAKRSVFSGVSLNVAGGFGAAPGQQDVGVGLSVPLPVVSRGQGAIAGAGARAEQAQRDVDAMLVVARAQVDGLHAEVVARRAALAEFTARAVASGDEMLEEAQAGYLAGRFSVLELADAYVVWRDARLRSVDLAAAARGAEVDLGRALGRSLRETR